MQICLLRSDRAYVPSKYVDLYCPNQLIDLTDNQYPGGTFYGRGSQEEVGEIRVKAGEVYQVRAEFDCNMPVSMASVAVPGLMVC